MVVDVDGVPLKVGDTVIRVASYGHGSHGPGTIDVITGITHSAYSENDTLLFQNFTDKYYSSTSYRKIKTNKKAHLPHWF